MDYTALASELIEIRANMLLIPVHQQLSKMTRGEQFVLNYLSTHENSIHPKELSEKMAVSTARIAALLNSLERKKLIQRYPDQVDNRQVVVVLTEEGKQEALRVHGAVVANVKAMLEKLGPEDAEAYIRIQKKVLRCCLENN